LLIHVILNKTIFGFELKACGYNRNAATLCRHHAKRNIVFSMTIAGALAGFGGGLYYLSGTVQYTLEKVLPSWVSTASRSHCWPPLTAGHYLQRLFVSIYQVGGDAMQPEFVTEIIDIIVAVHIYLRPSPCFSKAL
jgi:simple sugar transport system permease protein